jgi:hypothetical protein
MACVPLCGVLAAGVLVALGAGAGIAAALGVVDVFAAALDAPAAVLGDEAAGVGWGVTGGGCTAAAVLVLVVCAPPPPAIAAIAGSKRGMRSPASVESAPPTPGPIAAPTVTPSASIPAASAAVTRVEGRRGGPGTGRGGRSGSSA